jgi:hypothetical protein
MLTLHDTPLLQAEAKNLGISKVISKSDGHSLIAAIESVLQTARTSSDTILVQQTALDTNAARQITARKV